MAPIWLLVGILVGGVAGAALLRIAHARRIAELTTQMEETQARHAEAAAELAAAVARGNELEQDALRAEGDAKADIARLEAELVAERSLADEKMAAFTDVREELLARVGKSAGEALDGSGRQLVAQLKAELATVKAEATADLDRREKAVENLVKPLKDTMKQMGEAMEKVDIDRRKSHTELTQGLVAVTEAQKELRTETGVLSSALRQPQTRGSWGEMHLRRLVELAGMSALCDYSEQVHIDNEGRSLRPDMVVHLPGGKDIVVDSKAPVDLYRDACDATDDTARRASMKLYARGMRVHVRRLAGKDYAAQFDTAPDFVLMYVPGEHFFSAAVETDPQLIDDALRDGVLIATPTTLLVMLKTVAHSWQQEKVADEAQAIASLGQQLYERLTTYLAHVDRVSKCLNTLVEAQNKSVGSLERMVLPTARRFPELGAVAVDKQLPQARQVHQTGRRVQAQELIPDGDIVQLTSNHAPEARDEHDREVA
ncbi:MAG: DNA recombination protein RmuC [Tepidisphaeraceae bacterium]